MKMSPGPVKIKPLSVPLKRRSLVLLRPIMRQDFNESFLDGTQEDDDDEDFEIHEGSVQFSQS